MVATTSSASSSIASTVSKMSTIPLGIVTPSFMSSSGRRDDDESSSDDRDTKDGDGNKLASSIHAIIGACE